MLTNNSLRPGYGGGIKAAEIIVVKVVCLYWLWQSADSPSFKFLCCC